MKDFHNFELLLKKLDVETVYTVGSFTSTYQDSYANVQNPPAEVIGAGFDRTLNPKTLNPKP